MHRYCLSCLCGHAAGQTLWDTSSPRWVKTGPTRASQDFTTKSASECNLHTACKEQNKDRSHLCVIISCRTVVKALYVLITGTDTSSCTARPEPSAWPTWREATCTGSTSGEPCCPWARCCSAPAVSSLPSTGQTHMHKLSVITGFICRRVMGLISCCAERWSRRNRRSLRSSVSPT